MVEEKTKQVLLNFKVNLYLICVTQNPVLKRTVPQDLLPTFSPLNFIPCSRGPDRPKVSRQRAASLKRGRPAGSKNKKKNEQINKTNNSSTSDLPFFDSGDFCQICQFNLNDPIKRGGKSCPVYKMP